MIFFQKEIILAVIAVGVVFQSIMRVSMSSYSIKKVIGNSIMTGLVMSILFGTTKDFSGHYIECFMFWYALIYASFMAEDILPSLSTQSVLLMNIVILFYYIHSLSDLNSIHFFSLRESYIKIVMLTSLAITMLCAFNFINLNTSVKKNLYVWYLCMSSLLLFLMGLSIYIKINNLDAFHLRFMDFANWMIMGAVMFNLLINWASLYTFVTSKTTDDGKSFRDVFINKFQSTRFSMREIFILTVIVLGLLILNETILKADMQIVLNVALMFVYYLNNGTKLKSAI